MVACSSCHATVKPTKNITWWVVGLLLIVFWPGAILYILTRPKNTCPICGSRIPVPQARAPARLEQEAPRSPDPAPASSPAEVSHPRQRNNGPWLPQLRRRTWLTIFGALGAIILTVILIASLTPEDDDLSQVAPGGSGNTQSTSSSSNDLAEIALDSGKYVKWYLGNVQPLCNQYYGQSNCIPVVREVKLGGTCGARVAGQVSWPSDLPDGPIYLVEMRSVQGGPPRYPVISPGSKYDELPDDQVLFDCWDLR